MDDNYPKAFKKQFTHRDTSYLVHVIPFDAASDEDRLNYTIGEGEFLVHLFAKDSCTTFKVFYDDELEWNTNASTIIIDDRDLIETIGFLIDDAYA